MRDCRDVERSVMLCALAGQAEQQLLATQLLSVASVKQGEEVNRHEIKVAEVKVVDADEAVAAALVVAKLHSQLPAKRNGRIPRKREPEPKVKDANFKRPRILNIPKRPKVRPKSGFYGVTAKREKWRAQVYYEGRYHNMGSFRTREQAAAAFDAEARIHRADDIKTGDIKLNFKTAEEAEVAVAVAVAEWERQNPAKPEQKQPLPKSGFYGVYANRHKWQSEIAFSGQRRRLGTYRTAEEAGAAYDVAARIHKPGVGPFNFKSDEEGAAVVAAAVAKFEIVHAHELNTPKLPKSGYRGVYGGEGKWQAQINYEGKQHYLGRFNTKVEAAVAFDAAAREHRADEIAAGQLKCNFASPVAAAKAVI